MNKFVLTDVQYSILVKMLCTSTYSKDIALQTSLVNFVRSINMDLFDKSFPCPVK